MTPSQLADFARMPDWLRDCGTIGHQKTLNKFLKSRPDTKIRAATLPQMTYSVSGDSVDVGRFLSGEPECMTDYYGGEDTTKLCLVSVTMGRPSGCDNDQVAAYYGMVLDTIDKIETAGTRCKVVLVFNTFSDVTKDINELSVEFKEHEEPINMARFAGMVLLNDYQTRLFQCHIDEFGDGWNEDAFDDYVLTQTHDHICFPSLYYKQYCHIEADDMKLDRYLRDIDLAHLID